MRSRSLNGESPSNKIIMANPQEATSPQQGTRLLWFLTFPKWMTSDPTGIFPENAEWILTWEMTSIRIICTVKFMQVYMHNIYVNIYMENRYLIYSLVHSLIFISFSILEFIYSLVFSFIQSLIHSFIHSCISPPNYLFNRPFLNTYYEPYYVRTIEFYKTKILPLKELTV